MDNKLKWKILKVVYGIHSGIRNGIKRFLGVDTIENNIKYLEERLGRSTIAGIDWARHGADFVVIVSRMDDQARIELIDNITFGERPYEQMRSIKELVEFLRDRYSVRPPAIWIDGPPGMNRAFRDEFQRRS